MKTSLKISLCLMLLLQVNVGMSQNSDWILQSPPVTSQRLNDMDVIDAATVVAVGYDGTIIKTTNSGVNWTKQTSGTSSNLYAVEFTDANTGWAVGQSGTILKTKDGSTTWEPQASGTSKTLYSVHFINPDTGWTVGYERTVLKTVNGGNTWTAQYSTVPVTFLEDVVFLNSQKGIAVGWGPGGEIYRTTNGGQTWTGADIGNGWLKKIHFINDLEGWAAGITASYISVTEDPFWGITINVSGSQSTVWKTTDGGATWNPTILPSTHWLNDIYFTDANNGWVVGDNGAIFVTSNGGTSWTPVTSSNGTTKALFGVHFASLAAGWIIGDNGTILYSSDNGMTWNSQLGGTTRHLFAVQFIDENTGWAVGNSGAIVNTTNGGSYWSKQLSNTSNCLYDVQFVDASMGWTVGDNGTILKTTNQGSTWEPQTSGTSSALKTVYFIDSNTGWAGGDNGTLLRTDNGGALWQPQTSGITWTIYALHFIDAFRGWLVGSWNPILHTSDGGVHWMSQTGETNYELYAIDFVNETTGWAAGSNGRILKTVDAGAHWQLQLQSPDYKDALKSIYFIDASTGWAATYDALLKTTDGGANWGEQKIGVHISVNDVHFINTSTGWAVGYDGYLLKTQTGGGAVIAILPVPDLVSPDDYERDVSISPKLRWSSEGQNLTYHLEVATNENFSPTIINQMAISDTFFTITPELSLNTRYYWHIRTMNAEGRSSNWSFRREFTTGQPPTFIPTLLSPINGSEEAAYVKLWWYGESWQADFYHVQVSRENYCSHPLIDSSAVIADTLVVGPLPAGCTYYWRVRAGNNCGYGPFSDIWNFTIPPKLPEWITQSSPSKELLLSIQFVDTLQGWAVGWCGTILKTIDGGNAWTIQTSGTTWNLEDVFFIDHNTGWCVGSNGMILKTTDGGTIWTPQASPTQWNLYAVHFINSSNGWAVGSESDFFHTTNGGDSWTKVAFPFSFWWDFMNDIYFFDALHGWAAGRDGTILLTVDGGIQWTQIASGASSELNAIYFLNTQTGWAVGKDGTIVKTIDGGTTWGALTSGTTKELEDVQFVDPMIGYTVGAQALLKTTDGGLTWESPSVQGYIPNLRSISLIRAGSDLHGWTCGQSSRILHTVQRDLPFVDVKSFPHPPALPVAFELQQNYPNPFNATTCISYSLPRSCAVTLKIFNLAGQEVAMLVNNEQVAGQYQIHWTPANIASGVYLYQLQAGDFVETKKLIILQ